MKAAVVMEAGKAPVFGDFAEPQLADNEQLMTLVGSGVHQVTKSLAAGSHYGSDGVYPCVPGVDAVARTPDGALVYTGFVRAPWGTMTERFAAPLGLPLPADADPLAIAAGLNPATSGWLPLAARRDELRELGTVMVFGATGMAGSMAVESALAQGAQRVVAVGRDRDRLEQLAGPAVKAICLEDSDAPTAMADALTESAPSTILDYVWGPVAEMAFAALARTGLEDDVADISYIQIGALAGLEARVPASLLRSRRITIKGSGAGSVSTQHILAELPKVMALIADGTIEVPYTPYRLSDVGGAWEHTGRSRAVIVPD